MLRMAVLEEAVDLGGLTGWTAVLNEE